MGPPRGGPVMALGGPVTAFGTATAAAAPALEERVCTAAGVADTDDTALVEPVVAFGTGTAIAVPAFEEIVGDAEGADTEDTALTFGAAAKVGADTDDADTDRIGATSD